MKNKQTAVEWFIRELEKQGVRYFRLSEKALKMEKKQIEDAYFGGWHREFGNRDEDSQQYYNEEYGGNK
jgi:hypothetical protein